MLRALFKKQMMEVNAWFFVDRKSGKQRSKAGMVGLLVLYILLFGGLGGMIYYATGAICQPLSEVGLGWLYFVLMGMMAVVLGVFGSVFNTSATLYQAKDNELLLSMPVPPARILAVRLLGIWTWGLIYVALVFVPSLLKYWLSGYATVLAMLCGLLLLPVISVFVLTLSCLLGWCVAQLSARMKHKSLGTVIASLGFIVGYYYFYFRAYEMLQQLLANSQQIGEKIKGAAYPLYLLGRAGEGDVLSMFLFTMMVTVIFVVIYLVLSRSFLKMATTNRGAAKTKYKKKALKCKSAAGALRYKEWKRFLASPIYMLNCGLGTVMLLAAAGFIIVKGNWLREYISVFSAMLPDMDEVLLLIACGGICMLSAMNDITAPSVSLEGKNIWLVQSLPVEPWTVLWAKLSLHLRLTMLPVVLCSVCVMIVIRPDVVAAFLIVVLPLLFTLFQAAFGLAVNLKAPNLKWTNETVPVKQSMGVMVSLFGGWLIVAGLAALYFAVCAHLGAEMYLILCMILFAAADGALLYWLKHKGAAIFARLG